MWIPRPVSWVTGLAATMLSTGATQTFNTPFTGARKDRCRPSGLTRSAARSGLPKRMSRGMSGVEATAADDWSADAGANAPARDAKTVEAISRAPYDAINLLQRLTVRSIVIPGSRLEKSLLPVGRGGGTREVLRDSLLSLPGQEQKAKRKLVDDTHNADQCSAPTQQSPRIDREPILCLVLALPGWGRCGGFPSHELTGCRG